MIKQEIKKTNTGHLQLLRTEGISFSTHRRKPLGLIYTTSLLDLFMFLSFCYLHWEQLHHARLPFFALHLVLVFHLKTPFDKQCFFDISRLGVKEKLHNSNICEFVVIVRCSLFHKKLCGLMCSISRVCRMVHGSPVWERR